MATMQLPPAALEPGIEDLTSSGELLKTLKLLADQYDTLVKYLRETGPAVLYTQAKEEAAARRQQMDATATAAREKHQRRRCSSDIPAGIRQPPEQGA